MKQYWQKLSSKIDALTLRERGIVFMMLALAVIMVTNTLVLEPQFAKQKKLSQQIRQDQAKISEIRADILQKVKAQSVDPDAPDRARLQQLKQQVAQLNASLMDMQKGLVSPDKMTGLLEDILRRNGNLRLTSLKTLPVTGLFDAKSAIKPASEKSGVAAVASAAASVSAASTPPAAQATDGKADLQPAALLYKHAVEITLQGNYLDMLHYMAQLESMPMQVFWGRAQLNAAEYPQATLTLSLFTLSPDKKWLNL